MLTPLLLAAAAAASPHQVPQHVIVVGGSSGMGKAAAAAVVARGGTVLLVSRSEAKLRGAQAHILAAAGKSADDRCVQTCAVDASDEDQVVEFAKTLVPGAWDALIVSAAGPAPHGPITSLPTADTLSLFGSKFWSAYHR